MTTLDYYATVLQSLWPGLALFFGTLIAGKVLTFWLRQLHRTF